MDGAGVGVEVGAFADQDERIRFPRVAEVGDDHFQVREVDGDVFQLKRQTPLTTWPGWERLCPGAT